MGSRLLPQPRVIRTTVIIPVFNHESLTRQCLEAVLGTVGNDVEIIVVDDGSTDATLQMLTGYGYRVRLVTHPTNSGFAKSCNDGAAAASGEYLVFLNNDTIPQPGWLEALECYADTHPEAAVLGSKLLYPNNTIQHAGVVICQDRYPRHIYTGFPADHPAVNKSRRFQLVTAACMLVRRQAWTQVGGFDTAFRNGFEDVDFCLRLGEAGREIHYCADSIVHHLESVSPGRFKSDRDNIALYRKRWIETVQPDDLRYYIADGLLGVSYEGTFPIHLRVSPQLAVLNGDSRREETEKLLAERARQVADLTRENTRLRVELGGRLPDSPALEYEKLRQRIRETVRKTIPPDATVVVVSKGDSALLDLHGRTAWHFPQTPKGAYAGHHPADSSEAIRHLEELRARGAQYLLFPQTAFWWLDHYKEFKHYLAGRYRVVAHSEDLCCVFVLKESPAERPLQQRFGPEVRKQKGVLTSDAAISHSFAPGLAHPRRRKVLYVCHNHPAVMPGGAEVYALELYEAMRASNDFEPIFLARIDRCSSSRSAFTRLNEDRNQHCFGTKTSDFDFFYLTSRNKDYPRHFHQFLLTHQPDVVHFQHTHLLGYELIHQTRKSLPPAAIVYTLQEYLPICHRNGQMVRSADDELCRDSSSRRCHECFPEISADDFSKRKNLIQSYLSLVDLFVAPSQFLLERYVEWGIPPGKIVYEEYGRREFVQLQQSEKNRPKDRFAFFGQLNPFKGINLLLEAMRMLGANQRKPEANPHLWIHGANLELQRDEFQKEFKLLLDATKDNVTFPGAYGPAELPRLMANIDWVVVPSIWWENSPLVIQEAFGHGRPVICSDIGGMAEKVRDGVSGLHFRVGDPTSLAETIARASATPGLWNALRSGIPKVRSMRQHVDILSGLYKTILEAKTSNIGSSNERVSSVGFASCQQT
jgi:GT2 family glycosyltransferase/glycosyltransferase involved in cell wall biosynthesis